MGGFKLDASKHKKQDYGAFMGDVWAAGKQSFKDADQRIFFENQDQAFEEWGVQDDESRMQEFANVQEYRSIIAEKTALIEAELSQSKKEEEEALREKAQIKNWSDDKLADKLQDLEAKYEKLRKKKIATIKKEQAAILDKKQAPLRKPLEEKADMIDALIKTQKTGKLDKELTKEFNENFSEEKQSRHEKTLRKNEKLALKVYSMNGGYKSINGALRSRSHSTIPKTKMDTKTLTELMIHSTRRTALKQDTVLFRNSDLKGLIHFLGLQKEKITCAEDLMNIMREDMTVNGILGMDRAFLSTTLEKGGVTQFQFMQVEYRILAPKGTMATYVAPVSKYPLEKEMLLQSGTMFRVMKIKKEGTWDPEQDLDYRQKGYDQDHKLVVYMEAIQRKPAEKKKPQAKDGQ